MILTQLDIEKLSQIAQKAAEAAGIMISQYNREGLEVHHKEGASSLASEVVTEVDLSSQQIVLDYLLPTCDQFDLALLSEESPDDKMRFQKDYFWCIDPLDGTLSFIDQEPGYSVSIALVSKNGTPVIGVVYDPSTKILYSAISGGGLFRNYKRWNPLIQSDKKIEQKSLWVAFDRSYINDSRYQAALQRLNIYSKSQGFSGVEVMTPSGGVMNAIKILNHSTGCYFKFPKQKGGSLWDYAATALIYQEAGGSISDIKNRPMDLNRKESTYMNHRGFIYSTSSKLHKKLLQIAVDLVEN